MIFVNICTKHKKYFQIMNTSDSRESDSDDIRHLADLLGQTRYGYSVFRFSCSESNTHTLFEIVKKFFIWLTIGPRTSRVDFLTFKFFKSLPGPGPGWVVMSC